MGHDFETTRWSMVLMAAGNSPATKEALEDLCQAYWYPLYAFVRRQGHDPEGARDLTQSYFVNLLETRYLDRATPEAGKFRSFLLVSLKHFLSNERAREGALKRRADNPAFRITLDGAEERYRKEAGAETDPEAQFEKRWALTLMERAIDRLRNEHEARGQAALYARLRGFLTGEDDGKPYARVAVELEMSEGAVKVAVHRMRQRLALLLRDEVSQTVAQEKDVDRELRHLLNIVGS